MLADELESTEVEVLNVCPGPIRTTLRARAYLSEDPQSIQSPALVASQIIAGLMTALAA